MARQILPEDKHPSPLEAALVSRTLSSRARKGVKGFVSRPLLERFWEMVDCSGGPDACWKSAGSVVGGGYTRIRTGGQAGGREEYVHRVAWELFVCPIPRGNSVLHRCDNRLCANPAHLFLGNHQDNMRDMAAKGRGTSGALPFGVSRVKGGRRFASKVSFHGERIYLGTYSTIQQANAVAVEAKLRLSARRLRQVAGLEGGHG